MSHKMNEPPNNSFLPQVINMSLRNAEILLNDARLLINNNSFDHAFAFTILALEEIGKAIYCNWAKKRYVNVDKNFFTRLKMHKIKLSFHGNIETCCLKRRNRDLWEEQTTQETSIQVRP